MSCSAAALSRRRNSRTRQQRILFFDYSATRERAISTACEGSMNRNAISLVRLSRRTSSIRIANRPGCPRMSRKPAVAVPISVCGWLSSTRKPPSDQFIGACSAPRKVSLSRESARRVRRRLSLRRDGPGTAVWSTGTTSEVVEASFLRMLLPKSRRPDRAERIARVTGFMLGR